MLLCFVKKKNEWLKAFERIYTKALIDWNHQLNKAQKLTPNIW